MTVLAQNTEVLFRAVPRKWAVLPFLLLALTGTEFVIRGPVRALRANAEFNDLLSPYVQSHAFVEGLDPYSPHSLLQMWPADAAHFEFLPREVTDGTLTARRGIPTAYPVTCLLLLSPLTAISWQAANFVWLVLTLALLLWMLRALLEMAGLALGRPAVLLVAGVLALGPLHTGIATANLAVVATELGIVAISKEKRGCNRVSGILLGFSIALKPQVGLCFLLAVLAHRRWRIFAVAGATATALLLAALARLQMADITWVQSYLADNHALFTGGTLADFTGANPTRFGLLNLQVALYPLLRTTGLANAIAFLIFAFMLACWLAYAMRSNNEAIGLLDLSAIAVLSLLPVYHRYYDAILLVLPLCWGFSQWVQGRRRTAIVTWALLAPFLLPGGSALEVLAARGTLPASVMQSRVWETVVLPHAAWALLLLACMLLYFLAVQQRAERFSL